MIRIVITATRAIIAIIVINKNRTVEKKLGYSSFITRVTDELEFTFIFLDIVCDMGVSSYSPL